MRPYGTQGQLEARRLQAVVLFGQGLGPTAVARKLKADRRSVRRWKSTYLKNGTKGLKAKSGAGRPARLNFKNKKSLERALLRGPHSAGYTTDLWTCQRVAELINTKFSVHYHARYIPRLLRSMGWSPQKPERLARERDEKAIKHWVRTTWPHIKKKPSD